VQAAALGGEQGGVIKAFNLDVLLK
jgi:hypothetical protein